MVFRIVYYCCNHFRLSRFHPKTFDNIDHRRMCYLGNLSFDAIDISAFEKNSDGDIRTFRVEGEMAWTADRDRARLWNEDNLFRIRIDREDHRLRQRRNSDWTVWLKNKLNEILSIRWLDDITKQTFININSGENFLLGLILFCLVIDRRKFGPCGLNERHSRWDISIKYTLSSKSPKSSFSSTRDACWAAPMAMTSSVFRFVKYSALGNIEKIDFWSRGILLLPPHSTTWNTRSA